MYCKKCGTYNSNNSLRCRNCGDYFVNQFDDTKELNSTLEEEQKEEAKNNDKKNNNNKDNSNKKKVKKEKRTKSKKDKKSLFNHNKKKNNNSKDKDRRRYNNDKKQKEVIIKEKSSSGCFSKFIIFILMIIIILLVAISSGLGGYLLKDKVVKVPDFTGMTKEEATKILDSKDMNYELSNRTVSNNNDLDIVLEQNIDANKYILKSQKITLTIGSNNSKSNNSSTKDTTTTTKITLDNYVGKNINDIKSILNKKDIKYEIVSMDSNKDKGIIIKQSPTTNAITKSTTLTLYVSNGNTTKTTTTTTTDTSTSTTTTTDTTSDEDTLNE